MRMALSITCGGRCMAVSTGERRPFLDEQADPVPTQMPSASSACRSVSARTGGKDTLRICPALMGSSTGRPATVVSGSASIKSDRSSRLRPRMRSMASEG